MNVAKRCEDPKPPCSHPSKLLAPGLKKKAQDVAKLEQVFRDIDVAVDVLSTHVLLMLLNLFSSTPKFSHRLKLSGFRVLRLSQFLLGS